jgi:Obg family GTPase CgtA-like protein
MEVVAARLKETRKVEAAASAVSETVLPILRPREKGVRVVSENGNFRVDADKPVAFAEMMPLDTEEGRAELWRRFQRWGVTGALRRAGAKRGDTIILGRVRLEMEG